MVFLFMALYYNRSGYIANIAMFLNMFILICALISIGASFTLPAMAAENVVGPHAGGWFFQEGHNALNDRFVDFHNYVFGIVTIITFVVLGLMLYIAIRFKRSRKV